MKFLERLKVKIDIFKKIKRYSILLIYWSLLNDLSFEIRNYFIDWRETNWEVFVMSLPTYFVVLSHTIIKLKHFFEQILNSNME